MVHVLQDPGGPSEHDFSGSLSDLMKVLKVNPETVLCVKNGEVVTEDETVENNDEVRFLSVISGG